MQLRSKPFGILVGRKFITSVNRLFTKTTTLAARMPISFNVSTFYHIYKKDNRGWEWVKNRQF